MADKAITDLNTIPGSVDDNNTWFAVAQSGTAYKVSGHEFVLALGTILDGHGGVKSIVYTDPVSPSLTGTMVITLADDSTTTVSITNGKGITSIAKTGTSDLVDTYTISYNDGTTSSFTVTNGAKGDTGDAWYVWIRYAGSQPTSDSDIGTAPDDWIGIYSGTSSTAPTHYTDYTWFEFKGEKGDTGAAASLDSTAIEYQESVSGTAVPQGTWTTTIPAVTQGNYLWTRTTLEFNSGNPVVCYGVSYVAIDGQGSPGAQTPLVDSGTGVVGSATAYSRQDHQHPLNVATSGTPSMDGTASRGSASTYARSDHVHPTDTSKQNALVSGTNIKTVNGASLLGSGNIAAIPTGGDSGKALVKASASDYDVTWGDAGGALWFTSVAVSATTGDIATITDAAITADHVLGRIEWANPSYITTDITWTSSSGSFVLNGTCSTATTASVLLVLKNN